MDIVIHLSSNLLLSPVSGPESCLMFVVFQDQCFNNFENFIIKISVKKQN